MVTRPLAPWPIVSWNSTPRADWDAALKASAAAYQQDWAYGEALAGAGASTQVHRARITRPDGSLLALAQIVARPAAMIARFALCTLGPVWIGDVSADDKRAAYRALKAALPLPRPRILVVTPDEVMSAETGLAGRTRVMTGDATVRVDLLSDAEVMRAQLDGKWRNALAKAEKSALKVERVGSKPGQYRWLLDAESKQRERRGYRALPPELTEAWQAAKLAGAPHDKSADKSGGVLAFRADLDRSACAGMLFLLHGARATYHIGWSNEDGRANAAHNLLLWTAMLDLKARGLRVLDLGGVNTQSGAGIARFKLGTGGHVLQRAGAFV